MHVSKQKNASQITWCASFITYSEYFYPDKHVFSNALLFKYIAQPTRDSALNELYDLLVAKKLWFQSSEEDRKIVEDTAHSEAWDITGAKGGKIT